jgi:hypothetical protein
MRKEAEIEKLLVQDTVRLYLKAIVEAYTRLDTDLLKKVCTQKEWWKVEALVGLQGMKHQLMDAYLITLKFEDIQLTDKTATVRTYEKWKIRYLDMKTNHPLTEFKEVEYNIIYTLLKEGNEWKVDNTRFVEKK